MSDDSQVKTDPPVVRGTGAARREGVRPREIYGSPATLSNQLRRARIARTLLKALNPQRVFAHERLTLRACEHARRRADGANTARPQGTRVTKTAFRIQTLKQAEDVAGVEGVAAA